MGVARAAQSHARTRERTNVRTAGGIDVGTFTVTVGTGDARRRDTGIHRRAGICSGLRRTRPRNPMRAAEAETRAANPPHPTPSLARMNHPKETSPVPPHPTPEPGRRSPPANVTPSHPHPPPSPVRKHHLTEAPAIPPPGNLQPMSESSRTPGCAATGHAAAGIRASRSPWARRIRHHLSGLVPESWCKRGHQGVHAVGVRRCVSPTGMSIRKRASPRSGTAGGWTSFSRKRRHFCASIIRASSGFFSSSKVTAPRTWSWSTSKDRRCLPCSMSRRH